MVRELGRLSSSGFANSSLFVRTSNLEPQSPGSVRFEVRGSSEELRGANPPESIFPLPAVTIPALQEIASFVDHQQDP
jgi:hypothetical protein